MSAAVECESVNVRCEGGWHLGHRVSHQASGTHTHNKETQTRNSENFIRQYTTIRFHSKGTGNRLTRDAHYISDHQSVLADFVNYQQES